MAYRPNYSIGMVSPPELDNEDDLSEEERQEAYDRLEQQTFLPRFGLPNPPPIVTSATVIPVTPMIPHCGDQRPKLNILQLIALAIIHHVNRSPTGQELLQWIEDRFEYFMWHPVGLAQIRTRLQDFFFEYDPPVIPLSDKYHHFAMPWEVKLHLTLRYAVVVGHLNILFPADSSTSFRLMALPAELRLQVYEYALGFPCKQLTRMSRRDKKVQGRICSKVRYDEDTPSGWRGTTFFTGPKGITALALLSVSKKVREEAFPIFYRNNAFSISSSGDISQILTKMGATRRSFIRNLTIEYCELSHPPLAGFLTWLADFEELDNLTLSFSPLRLQFEEPGHEVYRAFSTIRGIKKLTIQGTAPQSAMDKVRAYLEPLLTQPRVKSEEVAIEGPARKKLKMDTT
ncbi:hypothetical protein SLS58_005056 [Diplodia intermedia]|uniref:DUF7730 domain-containing protein n=1 Tax=Diplodia intermedia TaxID=856260 RepID=A0ABR3TSP4_9PEZI